ncbi:MAG: FKBP-type peptidyl-prolyl cis-trans isomerase [Lentisphaeria bacterium]|nr:FKBP-type peptidyl-prolyl cis-trans isomerase [Lentisphaeria bacterium]NQZ66558.1 FKBP-type peptidyl-prolyl cis-trans isomerase [Lentisphaeria bacterium]
MAEVKSGDMVSIEYSCATADGEVFLTTEGDAPFKFITGGGQVMPGLEQAVIGMEVGNTLTAEIDPELAFGQPDPDQMVLMDLDQFPDDIDLELGDAVEITMPGEEGQVNAIIKEMSIDGVLVDANHPLAGEVILIEITLLKILNA